VSHRSACWPAPRERPRRHLAIVDLHQPRAYTLAGRTAESILNLEDLFAWEELIVPFETDQEFASVAAGSRRVSAPASSFFLRATSARSWLPGLPDARATSSVADQVGGLSAATSRADRPCAAMIRPPCVGQFGKRGAQRGDALG
jgi:hypothetical protein